MKFQSYNTFWRRIHKYAKNRGFPLRVMFELTYQCNFHCQHCYVPKSYRKKGELRTQEVFFILDELKNIDIEISVLSSLEKVSDINKIEVGKHGIIIRKGFYSGLLLPQVASEYGWDRQTFLEQTCHKAGLPADCYHDADIYIFSAEVFNEKED